MIDLQTIGRTIAKLRAERNFSQEDLADLANINRGYISRIENGHVSFSVPVLLDLAKALKVQPEVLLQK